MSPGDIRLPSLIGTVIALAENPTGDGRGAANKDHDGQHRAPPGSAVGWSD